MPSRSLGGRRARKPLALPPCRQTTGRTAGQRSIRVTGLGEVYPGEPRCAPHDHCASTCASTASVYGSQTVIPMAREVVRWCGGTPHALLGLGGMRLWAGPWRHALLLRVLCRRLLHQGRLACVGHPSGVIRTQIPAVTRLTKGHPDGA
jgi:hypothetical protein